MGFGERVQESLGHERCGQCLGGLDLGSRKAGGLLGEVGHGHAQWRLFGNESNEDLAVGGGDFKRGVFLPDGEAGIHDGRQEKVEVGAFVTGKVGADPASRTLECVAGGAERAKERPARIRIAAGIFQKCAHLADPLFFGLGGGTELAPKFAQKGIAVGIVQALDAEQSGGGDILAADLLAFRGKQELARPRGA